MVVCQVTPKELCALPMMFACTDMAGVAMGNWDSKQCPFHSMCGMAIDLAGEVRDLPFRCFLLSWWRALMKVLFC